jgi:hypothetical protein
MIRLSVFCVLLAIVFVTGQEQDNLVNTNVDRTLDLVSHIPKETITVTIENRGTKATRYYDYYVELNQSLFSFFRSKVKIMMIKLVYQ